MAENDLKTKDVSLYNPHDGLTGRDGGPYLDQVERERAEVQRARIEDREPDLENAPASAGTPLVTGGQLVGMANGRSNPSREAVGDPIANAIDDLAKNDDFPVSSVGEATVIDLGSGPEYNAADPTLVSTEDGVAGRDEAAGQHVNNETQSADEVASESNDEQSPTSDEVAENNVQQGPVSDGSTTSQDSTEFPLVADSDFSTAEDSEQGTNNVGDKSE